MKSRRAGLTVMELLVVIAIVAIALALLLGGFTVYQKYLGRSARDLRAPRAMGTSSADNRRYLPRQATDTSGLVPLSASMPRWKPDDSLEEIS
jgi:prepilin-type N-terminal cleavage/methylation domain-containing protein